MKINNIDQWKNEIRKIAKEKNISIDDMQQRYILEEFIRKISKSDYKDNLIIKGGFMISTLIGIENRTTRDIDVTYNSTIYNKRELEIIFNNIISTNTNSFFEYEVVDITKQQLNDKYKGYCCKMIAKKGKTKIHFKLDISNNTLIYPKEIYYKMHSYLFDDDIDVMVYPLENIIAEKYETTLDRGEYNSRIRDLYDVFLIFKENNKLINFKLLSETIIEVAKDRKTIENIKNAEEIIDNLNNSTIFQKSFIAYKNNQYPYRNESLTEILNTFKEINSIIKIHYNLLNG